MTEVIIKLLNSLKDTGLQMDEQKTYLAIEKVLDNYNIQSKSTALTVTTDIPDHAKIFFACKKLEGLSKTTLRNYAYTLRHFSDTVYKPVSSITTTDIRVYINSFDGKVKQSTIETKIYCLKSFFGWLRDEEYISKDPTNKIAIPKQPKRMREGLSVENLELSRNACIDARERAFLEFYLSTGCRVSEVIGLKLSDIKNNSIKVIGKGDKERVVFLNEKAMMYLKMYMNSRNDRNDNSDYIFVSDRKDRKTGIYKPIGSRAIEDVFTKIGKRCGLHLHPHLMRHTFASMMLKNGASLRVIQEMLGHSDPKTTNVYAKVSSFMLQTEHQRCAVA